MIRRILRLLPILAVLYVIYDFAGGLPNILALFKGIQVRLELAGIAETLAVDLSQGHPMPRDLTRYLRKTKGGGPDVATDLWGSRYKLVVEAGRFAILSCGPDKRCGTKDDLTFRMDYGR